MSDAVDNCISIPNPAQINSDRNFIDQLPVEKLYSGDPAAARLWHTPPERELSHVAALFGLRYEAPSTPQAIADVTRRALTQSQATLLHLRVGPHSAAQMRQSVLAALSATPTEAKG